MLVGESVTTTRGRLGDLASVRVSDLRRRLVALAPRWNGARW